MVGDAAQGRYYYNFLCGCMLQKDVGYQPHVGTVGYRRTAKLEDVHKMKTNELVGKKGYKLIQDGPLPAAEAHKMV